MNIIMNIKEVTKLNRYLKKYYIYIIKFIYKNKFLLAL